MVLRSIFQVHGGRGPGDQRDEAKPQCTSSYSRRVVPYSGKPVLLVISVVVLNCLC
jgi:hypothetical protein